MITIELLFIHHYFNLFDPQSWLSWLIRKKTKCDKNHIEWSEKRQGEEEVTGATSKGVVTRHVDQFMKERPNMDIIERVPIQITIEEYQNLIKGKGLKYDFWSTFFLHGWHWITGRWIGAKGVAASGKVNCSEYIAAALKETLKIDYEYRATTADIWERVVELKLN